MSTSASPTLLLLPGLGSDHRLWHLQMSLPYKIVAPDFIEAIDGESLAEYSKRFIDHLIEIGSIARSEDLILVGASMGGAVAQEMSRHVTSRGVILIGSLRAGGELRNIVKAFGSIGAGLLPVWVYRISIAIVPFVMEYLSGISLEEIRLCTLMYHDLSKHFFREGYRMLSVWKGCEVTVPILRVHGIRDHIIPYKGVSGIDVVIEDGKHLLCLSHAEIVNRSIKDFVARTSIRTS